MLADDDIIVDIKVIYIGGPKRWLSRFVDSLRT